MPDGNLCFYRENDIIYLFWGIISGFPGIVPVAVSGTPIPEAVLLFDRLMYIGYNMLNKTADR